MVYFACVFLSWPTLLFIFGIMLAFVSLIVGGIAWAFGLISGVPSWITLSVESIVLALTALIFWPLGYDGELVFYLSLFGAGACLFLLVANLLYRRAENNAKSALAFKPYSFDLSHNGDATGSVVE